MKIHSLRIAGTVLLSSVLVNPIAAQNCTTCQSFGTDFVDGGSFFQNSQSTANFTAHQEFTGCQDDYSDNILVDPNGNQYVCNTTPMTPSNTSELVTCPIEEEQMFSGNWTIVVISNNGDCDPIDYMREFYVSVGPQVTTTVTPVSSRTATSTATDTIIKTQSASTTVTGTASTVVIPNTGVTMVTVTPSATTSITFVALFTVSVGTSVTSTAQATTTACTTKTVKADVINTKIRITALTKSSAATAAATQNAARVAAPLVEEPAVVPVWKTVVRREEALGKRTPEAPTVTTTASTRTTTVKTQTVTSTMIGTLTTVSTSTLHPTVTVNGAASVSTVTAPTPTVYNTIYNIFSISFVTTTTTTVVTQTSTVTSAC